MQNQVRYRPSSLSLRNRAGRALWAIVYVVLFRPSPRPLHAWRRMLLRLFGARIGAGAHPYPKLKVFAPWNLTIGEHSGVADDVDLYSVDKIVIGKNVTISQYSFICTATHDPNDPHFALVTAPIEIGDNAWICADVFVAPGVKVGQGAVIGARSSAYREVAPWAIVAGNPAKFVRDRKLGAEKEKGIADKPNEKLPE